jgi:bacillithiol system protein YtxJ
VSHRAEAEFEAWRAALGEGDVETARVDVIDEKPLARGLTAELGVTHQSPQALVFRHGELHAHASHAELVRGWFQDQVTDG